MLIIFGSDSIEMFQTPNYFLKYSPTSLLWCCGHYSAQ